MDEKTTVKQWIENFKASKYSRRDIQNQCDAGWYDWFCKETSLLGKTKKLAPKVIAISESKKINKDTMYVWFKNNCPGNGSLYDDFRFADIESGDVQYTIIPASGHNSNLGKSEVWGRENDFKGPLVEGTWKDVLNFFQV